MKQLLLALALAACLAAQQRTKVILDTDIGTDIDDAWALAFAARHPGFDLLAVTITDGDTPARAKVACKLLDRAGRKDVPVGVGRATRVEPPRVDHQFSWAEDYTAKAPVGTPAAELIVQLAHKHAGEIVLIAVGPLQNVADALRMDPGVAKLFRRVVLMSGNVYGRAGGLPPIAEWNVIQAKDDATLVYGAGLPLTIVPLDSTTLVTLADSERERLRKRESPLTNALEALYRLWLESRRSTMTLHDQLAVAEAAAPDRLFGKYEDLPLIVDERGFTRRSETGKRVRVCLQPKRDEFMRYYIETLLQ